MWMMHAAALAAAATLAMPSFGTITVYQPEAAPQQVVLFLSGDGGWNLGVIGMAELLRHQGALVVGIDIRAFMKNLEHEDGCAYPAGDLESLSRDIQLRFHLPHYHRPILVGYSSGATLAYAAIAAAPPETFAGAISMGFCPDLELRKPLCATRGLKATQRTRGVGVDLAPYSQSTVPWKVMQGGIDQVCDAKATAAFVAATGATKLFSLPRVGHGFSVNANWESEFLQAYREIADGQRVSANPLHAPDDAALAGLPLEEVPATGHDASDMFAVFITGDGGWADLDKRVSARLAARGIPVVGWNSLDYYWTPRTPAAAAADLDRIIRYYAAKWGRSRVLVSGYSFGADVAPFLVNRLPESTKARVVRVALLGPSASAAFEFHVSEWLGAGRAAQDPTAPEIMRLTMPVGCVVPIDEQGDVCSDAASRDVREIRIGSGHHFGGDYDRVADAIAAPWRTRYAAAKLSTASSSRSKQSNTVSNFVTTSRSRSRLVTFTSLITEPRLRAIAAHWTSSPSPALSTYRTFPRSRTSWSSPR